MSEKMNKEQKFLVIGKYVYIIFFFALLSGLFAPIITGLYADKVFTGILVLWVGLIGTLLIYKATKIDDNKIKTRYILFGAIVIFGDFIAIFAATGRFG